MYHWGRCLWCTWLEAQFFTCSVWVPVCLVCQVCRPHFQNVFPFLVKIYFLCWPVRPLHAQIVLPISSQFIPTFVNMFTLPQLILHSVFPQILLSTFLAVIQLFLLHLSHIPHLIFLHVIFNWCSFHVHVIFLSIFIVHLWCFWLLSVPSLSIFFFYLSLHLHAHKSYVHIHTYRRTYTFVFAYIDHSHSISLLSMSDTPLISIFIHYMIFCFLADAKNQKFISKIFCCSQEFIYVFPPHVLSLCLIFHIAVYSVIQISPPLLFCCSIYIYIYLSLSLYPLSLSLSHYYLPPSLSALSVYPGYFPSSLNAINLSVSIYTHLSLSLSALEVGFPTHWCYIAEFSSPCDLTAIWHKMT